MPTEVFSIISGKIFADNLSIPLTLCAEQNLFTSSKALSHSPNKEGELLSFLYISVLKHTKGL